MLLVLPALALTAGARAEDTVESFDTLYNNLTVEQRGSIVELRRGPAAAFFSSRP